MIRTRVLALLAVSLPWFCVDGLAQSHPPKRKQDPKKVSKPVEESKPEAKKPAKLSKTPPDTFAGLREWMPHKLDATQKQSVDKLKADLDALEAKAEITPDMVATLEKTIAHAIGGTQKPSTDAICSLAKRAATMTADGKLSAKEVLELQGCVQAVLFSASITEAQITDLRTELTNKLKAANVASSDVQNLVGDAAAVASTAQLNSKKPLKATK